MIRVTVYKKENEITGLRTEGHADYAEEGSDIYCAAVSALVINTMNSIERFTDDIFKEVVDEDRAVCDFRAAGTVSHDAELLLQSLVYGLTDLSKDNEMYLSLSFEEVQ